MREIKFRAWDKDNGEWYHGGKSFTLREAMAFTWIHKNPTANIALMQYTGIKSKSGVEIYEGDVVQYGINAPWDENVPITVKSRVEWSDDGQWWLYCPGGSDGTGPIGYFGELEVIGDIYSNPDLLA